MNAKYEPRKEVMAAEEIKNLYTQMLGTCADDKEYGAKLVTEILKRQKPDGSFSVIDDYRCDSDIRVYYVYFPTYYATAALIFAANNDIASDMISAPLSKGLAFASGRKLAGHGFDSVAQQLEALNIYKAAGLYQWMQKEHNAYPEFCRMITEIIATYRRRVEARRTVDDWQVDFADQFTAEIAEFDDFQPQNIWYAAYGSNICLERFMAYINDCSDKTPPVRSEPIILPYNIYFACSGSNWDSKGIAFLDDTRPGNSYGRKYLITSEQFSEIQRKEGPAYCKTLLLGTDDGVPVYTFTAPEKRTDLNAPCKRYIDKILCGLKEVYPDKPDLVLQYYLYSRGILTSDDRQVLAFIRNSAHGVSLQSIAEHTMAISRVKKSVKKLVELELLVHDRRSTQDGNCLIDPNAIVYTKKTSRDLIDLILM